MVNIMKLKGKIVENGLTVGQLADEMKIDRATLYRRFKNGGDDLSIKEVNNMRAVLKLTPEEAQSIFFKDNVACNAN